ncbi:hypothetical protein FOPG_06024 [Fusarium oxysporum f. sp. conglutinans race 2 54008]|uniref:Apple domain-containing protein n=1 Tax=Fusarium oxysporum f. sp. conglutinans race 2 54008 TaxID=1089457 RepID=X0I8H7_FUSOX|nr:hypothetical protein FOPG_06024 [Fusarium oxysporum f. sp. conglutinans race 2 54008]
MVALKAALALLFISAASAIPTSAQWPKYDINGQVLDLTFDKRAPAICQPDDKDIMALRSNKADGSAFCSTYLRSTKTITATPLVTSDMTKMVTKTAILLKMQKVRINVYHIVRTKVMKTISTVITETKTALVTDFATKTITDTMTEVSTDTDTTQVTKTSTEQLTDVVTEQVTKTITTTIDLTSTIDVTDVDTQHVTVNVPSTVTVTCSQGLWPSTDCHSLEYHCAIPGYGQGSYMVASGGAGPSSSWDSCKSFCSVQQNAVSFGFGPSACTCYSASAVVNTYRDPGSVYQFSDFGCPSQSKPVKRAEPVKQVPSYLPLKDPRVVSSACSCHITNKPAAATTQTVSAKEPKTVPHMVTKYTTSYITKRKVTTVTSQVTRTATDFKTVAKTDRRTKAVTQRKSATVTKPLKVTVTNYKTVVVTNFNTVGVTNRNTIRTTDYDTASETAYNSVVVTNVGYVTVTEYDTVVATDVATNTVIPDAVTVTGGDSYVWGS